MRYIVTEGLSNSPAISCGVHTWSLMPAANAGIREYGFGEALVDPPEVSLTYRPLHALATYEASEVSPADVASVASTRSRAAERRRISGDRQ